jgi:hypothetical protein
MECPPKDRSRLSSFPSRSAFYSWCRRSCVRSKTRCWENCDFDGLYVGYLNELKGNKKIMLLPGEHEVTVRQAGYKDFATHMIIEPGRRYLLRVAMQKDLRAKYPGSDAATLKLDINPKRAAVFLDNGYVGHASDFGGAFRSMALSPGRHRIKVELPGYQTFETEIKLLPNQESEIKTELLKGSIRQASSLVKEP